jgi:hypothetical protein
MPKLGLLSLKVWVNPNGLMQSVEDPQAKFCAVVRRVA